MTVSPSKSSEVSGRSLAASGWAAGTTAMKGSRSTTRERNRVVSNGGRARPMSSSPRRMPSTCALVTRSDSTTSTSGSAAVRRRSSGPRIEIADTAVKPRRTTPAAPASTRRARSPAPSTRLSSRWASSRNATPAPVSSTRRLSRSRRRAPTDFSSFWICRDSGGWVIWSRSAARPKCSSSATATKERTWSRVITGRGYDAPDGSVHAELGLDRHQRANLVSVVTPRTRSTSMRKQTLSLAAVAAGAALALSACGGVQNTAGGGSDSGDYPSGSVEMPVGADPGGSSDLISRQISQGLSEELGGSFPVINRSGANGALAAAEVAKAEPDGSTISVQNASLFAITPLAVPEDQVTSIDDFDVVQGVSRDDYVLVASKGSGFDSIESFQDADGKITYGTTGVGTGAQLACALTFNVNKTPAEAIPFDGGAPVDTACLQVGEAIENIESGKIVPITVYGPERVEFLPDVPTAQEQGLDVEVAQYRFMTVPKGTPQDIQDSIAEAMQATFETSEYQDFNEQNNLTPMEISGDEVVAQLEEDKQRYADLVEEYGIDLGDAS